jgi:DNA polymerase III epsilon subunit-like protein
MTAVWCDTETTGIDPRESGAFELAFLVYKDGRLVGERVYHLNPLNDEIHFSGEAYQANGVPEKTIRSYPPLDVVMPEIVTFLKEHSPPEKLVFAGYKCGFDYDHLGALLTRCGFNIDDYFNGRMIDVLELAKKAKRLGLLAYTKDNRLETMTKSLGIKHDEAHTALSDIKATRCLYEAIFLNSRS